MSVALELPQRIPPHNLDAERAVLGTILTEGTEALSAIGALSATDFYTDINREVFGALVDTLARDGVVTVITLAEELRRRDQLEFVGGAPYLDLLVESSTLPGFVARHAALVHDMATLRELIRTSAQIMTRAFDAREGVSDIVAGAAQHIDVIATRSLGVAPLPVKTWAELVARKREKLDYLWPGWIVRKKVMLVAGAGDSMKSFLCAFVGAMVGAGRPALEPNDNDNPCAQGPVLIVSAENGEDEDARRVQLIQRGHQLPAELPISVLQADELSLRDEATWASFTALVRALQPILIVVDSAIAVADLENENDNSAVAAFMKRCIQPLARVHGATVLLIVHSPKPPTSRGSLPFTDEHVARGASAWRNAADGMLYLKRDRSLGKDAVVLRPAKTRMGFRHPPIWFRIENTELDSDGAPIAVQVRYGGEFTEETGQASEAAAALTKAIDVGITILKATPGIRTTKLVEGLVAGGITEATARRAMAVLRGSKEWPGGPYRGKKQHLVDEVKGPGKIVFLTFNSALEAIDGGAADDDEVPF